VSLAAESTDVFIVGGGPAGLAAAIAAREKGLSAMVADGAMPPIEKPCGEGLMPETVAALGRLGVRLGAVDGRKVRGIRFVQADADAGADFRAPGFGVRRPLLHQRMVQRAEECGVEFLWKTPVTGIEDGIVRACGRKISARWIVGADGQGSRVRRWSGLEDSRCGKPRYAVRRRFAMAPWSNYVEVHWSDRAQAYVTPIGSDEVCVVTVAEREADAEFAMAVAEMPQLSERLTGAASSARERGAVTLMRKLRRVQRGNVALVGDASGGVDAITGEGLRLAFAQALALAEAMASGDLRIYERAHRRIGARPRWMGSCMLFLGRHPEIRRRVIRTLRDNPELFARLLETHTGETTAREILSAGALLGWRLLAV
jgi:menaquinone-9 beta-reductase